MSTPLRSMRIPDNPWKPAMERATREGTTLTAVVIAFLRRYAAGAAVLALVMASFSGSARASAPVTSASNVITEAVFVATVRTFGADTAIAGRTDAELIASGKAMCADIAAGQTVGAYWSQVASTYSVRLGKAAGVSSYAQWVSIFGAWRQSSILTFCPSRF